MGKIAQTFIFLFICCIQLTHAQGAEEFVTPSDRVKHYVSVRESTDTGSPVTARLEKNHKAKLIESVPFWHKIELSDGMQGYVSKAWTKIVPEQAERASNELKIHFLNVDPGTCTLVECPGDNVQPLMVDCGAHCQFDTDTGKTEEEAKEYITEILSSYTTKPNLVLSHADYDHYTYIPTIFSDVNVEHIWQGGDADDYGSKGFPAWLTGQRNNNANIHVGFPANFHTPSDQPIGDELSCGLANTYILTVNTPGSKNTNSLVLLIEYGDFTAIFTGDATGITEDQIRANCPNVLKASVLVGSHQGADTHRSNSVEWAQAVTPKVTVFSSGWKFNHPRCDSVEKYEQYLSGAPSHPVQCDGSSEQYDTTYAEYMTEINGITVITSNGRSLMYVECSLTPDCNGYVNH